MARSILIWGSGAIGGTIGAFLIRAGLDVTLVDLVEDHVRAITAGGLAIEGPVAAFTAAAPAYLPDELEGEFDLVLLAVKAQNTTAAAKALAPHLLKTGAVVSFQNGLNEPVIAREVGAHRTIGAFVNFGADWLGPGRINYGGRGAVVVGEIDGSRSDRLLELCEVIRHFDPDTILTDNIYGYLWSKLAYGAVLSSQAVTNETTADFLANLDFRPLITEMVREVLAIGRAEGVTPMPFQGFDPDPFERNDASGIDACIKDILERRKGSTKHYSGIWRDLVIRKRPTEVSSHLQPVRELGIQHGLSTAMVDHLMAQVASIESGRRRNDYALAVEMTKTARHSQRLVGLQRAGTGR